MRSQFILISAFMMFLMISCEDIVNSDKNIKITEVEYKSIKEDQENNVIFPLKTGNTWYYDVYIYNEEDIATEYIDSIFVAKEVTIDREKWHETYFPMLSSENIYLSNTNEGLWVKCDQCENQSFLLARYPEYADDFASGYTDLRNLLIGNESDYLLLEDLLIRKSTELETVSVPKGEFDCIKYSSRFETENQDINEHIISEEFYTENLGLVRMVEYELLSDEKYKIYELRDEPVSNNDCLETKRLNLRDIPNNVQRIERFILNNNTSSRLIVQDIIIEYTGLQDIATISPTSSLPVAIDKGSSLELETMIYPNQTGRFIIEIKVMSDIGCFYEIIIEGRSV